MALIFLSTPALAQTSRIPTVVHDTLLVDSKTLGERRSILVKRPPTYNREDQRYPVVYMLDAHWPQNEMMAGIVDQQAWSGMIPEVIVVGIQNTVRVRDLTPTATERKASGGGAKFLEFIETEVVPLIDKTYRTVPYRIFAGHSLGGLFVIYSFVERPHLFNSVIAVSPVLDWDDNFVIKRAEAAFKNEKRWNKNIYVAIGDEPEFLHGYNAFQSLLKREKPNELAFTFRQFKGETHGSVLLPAYLAGFRKIFDGWETPTVASAAELISHFRRLSRRFGYTVVPPESLVNTIGYNFLRAGRTSDAIETFRVNVEHHPRSPYVHYSLGEGLEKAGRDNDAIESYRRAIASSSIQEDTDLIEAAKTKVERLTTKGKGGDRSN